MLSEDYQTLMAEAGLTPARTSLASLLGDDEYAEATVAAASNAKLTPAAPGWATVEGSRALEDLFSAIAQGGDVEELAAEGRRADEQPAQRLTSDDHRWGRRQPLPPPGRARATITPAPERRTDEQHAQRHDP